MRHIILTALLLTTVAVGCGERADEAVYDTENNPHGFPKRAVVLLEQVESGKLATFDLITQAFDELYTKHPELLDNAHWRKVIKRLGREFETRAEEFAGRGIEYYSQAAGYYTLAAFARPEREALTKKSLLFEGWTRALRNVRTEHVGPKFARNLSAMTQITRQLMLGDSLQQAFAREYIIDSYLEPLVEDSGVAGLPPADLAFMDWLGLAELNDYEPRVEFTEPPIHLVAARTAMLRPNLRLELYFVANDSIPNDWHVTLVGADADGDSVVIEPQPPVSAWKPGEVQVVTRTLSHIDRVEGLALGLSSTEGDQRRWSKTANATGPVHIVDAPASP
jgi:hypothetical protein